MNTIVLIIPVLCVGGAEKVITRMANWWAKQGVTVYLVNFNSKETFFPLSQKVIRLNIDDFPASEEKNLLWPAETTNISKLRRVVKHILKQTEVRPLPVISFLSRMNLRVLLATEGLPCDVVVSERIYPPLLPLKESEENLRKELYPKAKNIICVSEEAHNIWAKGVLNLTNSLVIYNPISNNNDKQFINLPDNFIFFAGRLEPQKQLDKLIAIFANLRKEYADLKLVIAGDGSLQSSLAEYIKKFDVLDSVILLGRISNVESVAGKAKCFVFTSAFEGFPNVLLEVMSAGCPVVSFDCKTGPKEIIRNGKDGFIVPLNALDSLKDKVCEILDNHELRKSMSQAAKEVNERFSQKKIMHKWETLFKR